MAMMQVFPDLTAALAPPDRTDKIKAKFEKLVGFLELGVIKGSERIITRGATQGNPGGLATQTVDDWAKECGLIQKISDFPALRESGTS